MFLLGLEQRARAGARGLRDIMAAKQKSEAARSEIMRKAGLDFKAVHAEDVDKQKACWGAARAPTRHTRTVPTLLSQCNLNIFNILF